MASEPKKPPVRIRRRVVETSDGERLVADAVPATGKKRQPNSGSMKKGETRNPNGRPKGAKGAKAITRKVLSEKTTVRINGKPVRVTLYQALLMKESEAAVAGDWRARKTMLELGRWAMPEESPGTDASSSSASAADQAIIDWFTNEVRAAKGEDEQ